MDLHNKRRIGDYHPILLLLSALILIHKIIYIHILTSEVLRRLLIGVGELPFFSGSVPDHQDSIVYDLFFLIFSSSIFITIIISSFVLIIPTSYSNQHILYP